MNIIIATIEIIITLMALLKEELIAPEEKYQNLFRHLIEAETESHIALVEAQDIRREMEKK